MAVIESNTASNTLSPIGDTPWRERAACRGLPTELWYSSDALVALEVCAGCPVRSECLDDALGDEERTWRVHGVRGGATARTRARLLRRASVRTAS